MINLKKNNGTIASKIIKSVSLTIVVLMLVTSIAIYSFISKDMNKKVKTNMNIITEELYENFSNLISIQMNDMTTLSLDNDIVNFIIKKEESKSIVSSTANTLVEDKLQRYINNNPDYEHIFLTDSRGIVVCDSDNNYINYDFSSNEYVIKALGGSVNMSSVYVAPESGKPVISVVAPIKDANGNVIGTIGKNIFPSYFSKRFDSFTFLNSGHVFIVDSNNQYIYNPDKYYINKKTNIKPIENLLKNKNLFNDKNIGNINYKDGSNSYTAMYASVPELKTLLVLNVMDKDINSDAKLTGFILLIAAVFLIVTTIIVINIRVKGILKPLKLLIKYSEEISRGDLSKTIEVNGTSEIMNFSLSFRKMTENIKDLLVKLKTVTEELTKISDVVKTNQNSAASSMDQLNESSDLIMKDNEKIDESLVNSYDSFKKILYKTEDMREQSQRIALRTEEMKETYKKGISVIENLNSASQKTKLSIGEADESFNKLTDNVKEIEEVTNIVTSILRQTNILALNASIEAARAGAGGSGFSVVAEQMKRMSLEVSEHMRTINNIIGAVADNIDKTKTTLEEVNNTSVEEASAVKEVISNYEKVLSINEDFTKYISAVNDSINVLNAESKVVSSMLDEVKVLSSSYLHSSEEINTIIKNQAEGSAELVKLTGEMEAIVSELNKNIEVFTL